ncbi:MAG TPA: HD-GYP domain-containing protein, partial [Roseiflexaceae bacterium]|nr:HD-GYP domain-containing protein [Roseiflexaceae bacterium]
MWFQRFIPQPLTAVLFTTLALVILSASIVLYPETLVFETTPQKVLIALFLGSSMIFAGRNPIHIRHNIKVVLTTAPSYATVMLLPPLLAGMTVAVAVVITEILTRAERGNTVSDIATGTARLAGLVTFCAIVAVEASARGIDLAVTMACIALLMLIGDIVGSAFEIAPMSGDSPWRLMPILFREGHATEAMQYLLGVLATLAAFYAPWSLLLWPLPIMVVQRSFKYACEMQDVTARLLESMADAVDLRDAYTGGHSRRVTRYSMQILEVLGISGPEVELIRSAARVHDIGKIGIPDHVLNKPGRLTEEETLVMNSHPVRGAELLARYRDFARGIEIVRGHHERWDGLGYPDGLKGMDIPFGARVIAVADSFDAMTSDRPYRKGMSVEQATPILRAGRGTQWDAALLDA